MGGRSKRARCALGLAAHTVSPRCELALLNAGGAHGLATRGYGRASLSAQKARVGRVCAAAGPPALGAYAAPNTVLDWAPVGLGATDVACDGSASVGARERRPCIISENFVLPVSVCSTMIADTPGGEDDLNGLPWCVGSIFLVSG